MTDLLPDLSDKIIFIYKIDSNNDITLQNPKFEIYDGKRFLVGKVPDGGSSNDWLSGVTAYVAWDRIEEFVLFDSLEDYHSRLSLAWTESSVK